MLSPKEVKDKITISGMTQEEFASKVDVSQQVVSLWFKRGSIPAKYWDRIKDILNIREGENADENRGDILSIDVLSANAGASICMDIDCIDEVATTGQIMLFRDGMQFKRKEDLIAIQVSGTSMLPTIMPNEYVIIDRSIKNYVGDDLYVLNFAGNMLVKRLQFDPTSNSFDIISDNPQYTNYKLNLNEEQSHFHIIGKVVTTIRR